MKRLKKYIVEALKKRFGYVELSEKDIKQIVKILQI